MHIHLIDCFGPSYISDERPPISSLGRPSGNPPFARAEIKSSYLLDQRIQRQLSPHSMHNILELTFSEVS